MPVRGMGLKLPRVKDYPGFLEAWNQRAKAPRLSDAPSVVSVFSGCGGSSTGYRMAGMDVRLAVDHWDRCVEAYRLNWGSESAIQADVTTLDAATAMRHAGVSAGEIDVLDGSPPCQGFSTAGKRIIDDPRNGLFRDYARLIKALKPKSFVMENVAGMAKGTMRPVFRAVTQHLHDLGYDVRAQILDASWLGVPQERRRIIWVGSREALPPLLGVHPVPLWRQVSMAHGLQGVSLLAADADAQADRQKGKRSPRKAAEPSHALDTRGIAVREGDRVLRAGSFEAARKNPKGADTPGLASEPSRTIASRRPPKVEVREDAVVYGGATHEAARGKPGGKNPARRATMPAPIVVARRAGLGGRRVFEASGNHGVYNGLKKGDESGLALDPTHVQGVDDPRDAGNNPAFTLNTKPPLVAIKELPHGYKSERIIPASKPAPPVTALMADKRVKTGHERDWRPLTHQECARLQSFPDDYEFAGSESERVKMIGNAVPCVMAALVGFSVARHVLKWEGRVDPVEAMRPWTT